MRRHRAKASLGWWLLVRSYSKIQYRTRVTSKVSTVSWCKLETAPFLRLGTSRIRTFSSAVTIQHCSNNWTHTCGAEPKWTLDCVELIGKATLLRSCLACRSFDLVSLSYFLKHFGRKWWLSGLRRGNTAGHLQRTHGKSDALQRKWLLHYTLGLQLDYTTTPIKRPLDFNHSLDSSTSSQWCRVVNVSFSTLTGWRRMMTVSAAPVSSGPFIGYNIIWVRLIL